MNPYREMKTEVLRNILAAFTASYGRMLTEAETVECKETIELITLELASRDAGGQDQNMVINNEENRKSFMSAWF